MAAGQKRLVVNPEPFGGPVNEPVRPLVFCSGSGRLLRLACLFLGFKSPRLGSALAIKLNRISVMPAGHPVPVPRKQDGHIDLNLVPLA